MFYVHDFDRVTEDFRLIGVFSKKDEAEPFAKQAKGTGAFEPHPIESNDHQGMIDKEVARRFGPIADLIAANGLAPWPGNIWLVITKDGRGYLFPRQKEAKEAFDKLGGERCLTVRMGLHDNGAPGSTLDRHSRDIAEVFYGAGQRMAIAEGDGQPREAFDASAFATEHIAKEIQSWLDWQKSQRDAEGLPTDDDTAVMSVPCWPSRRQLKNWIAHLSGISVGMEPTEAMLDAARDWSVAKYGIGIGNDAAIGCWQAMLKAAIAEQHAAIAAVTDRDWPSWIASRGGLAGDKSKIDEIEAAINAGKPVSIGHDGKVTLGPLARAERERQEVTAADVGDLGQILHEPKS